MKKNHYLDEKRSEALPNTGLIPAFLQMASGQKKRQTRNTAYGTGNRAWL